MKQRKLIVGLLAWFVAGGCVSVTQNDGEWSIDFRQGITIKTHAAKTTGSDDDNNAQAGFRWPALVNWLFPEKPPEPKADEPPPVP